MNNRWCIVAGPRSGSSWLENSIYEALRDQDPDAAKLMEIIHPHASVANTMEITQPTNTIIVHIGKQSGLKSHSDILDHAYALIGNANKNQALTCRVFNQEYYTPEQYHSFLQCLLIHGFRFIKLERNLLDRVISLYVAIVTDIWHRFNGEESKNDSVTVNLNRFMYFYKTLAEQDKIRQNMMSNFPHVTINYEQIDHDVNLYNIPFKSNPKIVYQKTYDTPYHNKISNYNELLEAVKNV